MNPIDYTIRDLKYAIPRGVLEVAFFGRLGIINPYPDSLDYQIRDKVINGRVRVDCDLLGAEEVFINLEQMPKRQLDTYNTIYQIPKKYTQNRAITSIVNLSYGTNSNLGMGANGFQMPYTNQMACGNSFMVESAASIMRSYGPVPIISTALCRLIGDNVVLVSDYTPNPRTGWLRCFVSHDPEMSNIQPRAYQQFSELVLYATQAWCYTNAVVEVDMGALYGGVDIGVIRDIISNWADADRNYRDYLRDHWTKVQFMSSSAHSRVLRNIIGGMRS